MGWKKFSVRGFQFSVKDNQSKAKHLSEIAEKSDTDYFPIFH